MLEEIINRRLVLAYARRIGDAPSAEELAKAQKQLQIRLAAQRRKVSDMLKAESITAADHERGVVWRLVWDRYLAKYRTPDAARPGFKTTTASWTARNWSSATFFFARPPGPPEGIEALEKQAASIRAEIAAGKLDFAAFAEKFSPAPAAKRAAGWARSAARVRWTSRSPRGLQTEGGRDRPPVRSPFGVHLIRCDEVVPGTKKLSDLSGPIDAALAKELLEKISELERKQTPVKYTSAWPHFKPGTRELAK